MSNDRRDRLRTLISALDERMEQWSALGDTLKQVRARSQRPVPPAPVPPVVATDAPGEPASVAPMVDGPGDDVPGSVEPASSLPVTVADLPSLPVEAVSEPSPLPAEPEDPEAEDDADQMLARLLALAEALPEVAAARPVEEAVDRLEVEADLLPTLVGEAEDLIQQIREGLAAWAQGQESGLPDLRRQVHTLKGTVGMAGAKRTRGLLHDMETAIEQVEAGRGDTTQADLAATFDEVERRLNTLFDPAQRGEETGAPSATTVAPRHVRVDASLVDYLTTENNEARLASVAIEGQLRSQRGNLRELADNAQSLSRLLRDLEMYAESQIQSHRARLAPGEEFDALELDQYTHLHEISRSLNELIADTFDLHRDLNRGLAEQEGWVNQQGRAINEVQVGLHKTRLTPVDEIHDRLYRVAWSTGHELGKPVNFILDSGRLELDRVLLDRIIPPMEHLLRNAVDHGLEYPAERLAAGKPAEGTIRVSVRQDAGRISIRVEDDGGGLRVAKVRARAIERGLWDPQRPMLESEAADMICQPGFSTAAAVSQISGRGVGMDVVRSSVLALGGRFEVASHEGAGMVVTIHLPTMVATASVLVVRTGGERMAIPVDLVEDVERRRHEDLAPALAVGKWPLSEGVTIPLARLSTVFGLPSMPAAGLAGYVVVMREGSRRVAVMVDELQEVMEAPLRPAGLMWAGLKGVAGTTVLPDGSAAFLIDPLRAPWNGATEVDAVLHHRRPPVLVVDDSITVRKASTRFLEQHGFTALTAKDGQEALEALTRGDRPLAVLMDVEMPRMNGFQCLQAIRENERLSSLPVIMITSRTAPKHRQRAEALGVLGYLGKPFNEDELYELLRPLKDADAPPQG